MHIKSIVTALVAAPTLCMAAALPIFNTGNTESVAPNDFRFIVSIQTEEGWSFCGGTLLDSTTVMTAGHCTEIPGVEKSKIRVGSHVRSSIFSSQKI